MQISDMQITPLDDGLHALARVSCDSLTPRRSEDRMARASFAYDCFPTPVGGKARNFGHVATDEEAILRKHDLI